MPECKSCQKPISPEEAAASLFDLGFLRLNGMPVARWTAKIHVKRVGPLCPECLRRRKDLGIEPR
jgi:hypothetical protein